MTYGLSESDWAKVDSLCIAPLKKAGARVWIFGSRATGANRPFSDLDLLYEPTIPLSRGIVSSMIEALEESDLPIKVDLVEATGLAESYRAAIFLQRIEL